RLFVAHHGSLGSFVRVYCHRDATPEAVMRLARRLPGIETVHDKATAARMFDLPIDREADVVVISDGGTCLGNDTLRARPVGPRRPCVAHPWRHRRKSCPLHSKLSAERDVCSTCGPRRLEELPHLRLCNQWRGGLRKTPVQRSRKRGSRTSRSASPNRLKPKTASAIAAPGKTAIHGAVEAYSSAPPCRIKPQAAVGSCTPRPR